MIIISKAWVCICSDNNWHIVVKCVLSFFLDLLVFCLTLTSLYFWNTLRRVRSQFKATSFLWLPRRSWKVLVLSAKRTEVRLLQVYQFHRNKINTGCRGRHQYSAEWSWLLRHWGLSQDLLFVSWLIKEGHLRSGSCLSLLMNQNVYTEESCPESLFLKAEHNDPTRLSILQQKEPEKFASKGSQYHFWALHVQGLMMSVWFWFSLCALV